MNTLRLVGWTKEPHPVPLVEAVQKYSTGSLVNAQVVVDALLDGAAVTVAVGDDVHREEFRSVVTKLGVIVE